MNLKEIKQIIKKEVNSLLSETQRSNYVLPKLKEFIVNSKIFVSDDLKTDDDKLNQNNLKKEAEQIIIDKIYNIQQKGIYENDKFFIVKLGKTYLKNENGLFKISFDDNVDTAVLYIIEDTIVNIEFINQFFITDKKLIENLYSFILKNKIKLDKKGFESKVHIEDRFNKNNIIDLTDYIKKRAEKLGISYEPISLKPQEKVSYRKGEKIKSPVFGKGTIISTKFKEFDKDGNKIIYVTAEFPVGIKTLATREKRREIAD